MSSLVLVKRAEKVPEKDRRVDNPLLVNDAILYPNLGDPVSKAAKEVGFYFAVYPASAGGPLESTIELLQDGNAIGKIPMALGTPNATGRIQQAGRLPIDQLASGTYELRAVVKQGNAQVFRSTMLRIVD
jgi:hypothetical protein